MQTLTKQQILPKNLQNIELLLTEFRDKTDLLSINNNRIKALSFRPLTSSTHSMRPLTPQKHAKLHPIQRCEALNHYSAEGSIGVCGA